MRATATRQMRWVVAALVAAALVASGCSGGGADQAGDGTSDDSTLAAADEAAEPVEPTGQLSEASCPDEVDPAAGVDCYELVVPEDHTDPEASTTLTLPVAVVHPTGGPPPPDPVLFPSGGPGYDDVAFASEYTELADSLGRDLILWDQRGTGLAEPSLNCPEKEEAYIASFEVAGTVEEETAPQLEAMDVCHARLVDEGIDLDTYDTVQNTYDAIALRQALGLEQWNVLGVSYGSRIGLELMRQDPEGTRAAILDSVYPTDRGGTVAELIDGAERAFTTLFEGCASDPSCAEAHPDLEGSFQAAIERYDEQPLEVPVTLDDGTEIDLVLTGADIYAGLFVALYDTSLIPLLPSILDDLAAGETGVVPEIARRGIPFTTSISEGMNAAFDCADNAVRIDEDEAADAVQDRPELVTLVTSSAASSCGVFDVAPVDAGFEQPVDADIPTLVLAGSYDPITPPEGSEAAAEALPDATFVLFEGVGHGVGGTSDCPDEMERAFLDDPTAPVDTSCAAALPGPAFT